MRSSAICKTISATIFCGNITTPPTKSKILAALLLGAVASNHAYVTSADAQGNVRRWRLDSPGAGVPTNSVNRATRAIRYYLPVETANADAAEAERDSLRVAFTQWQSIPGARVRFEEAGLIAGGDINLNDGTNLVFFAKSELINGGRDSIFNRGVALTYFKTINDNELAEADIVFNSFQFPFFSDYFDKANLNFFIESTALHEIGHWLGLDHSPVGGATMFVRTLRGVTAQTGLSEDEIGAARALYPDGILRGSLVGRVLKGGSPLFGAVATIEDLVGNATQSTVSSELGDFLFSQISPGNYNVRVSPLDPAGSSLNRILTGADISQAHAGAVTSFLPTTNTLLEVRAANIQGIHDFVVADGTPPLRITRIIPPSPSADSLTAQNVPAQIAPGTSNVLVGVGGPTLPTSAATLEVTGAGITLGTTRFLADPFETTPPLRVLYASIAVATNATPGLRSFVVRSGTNVAYANGFLEITNPKPDENYDGVNDIFQRTYFPLFTSMEAGPLADPDADTVHNFDEAQAGTSPVSATSRLEIEQTEYIAGAAKVHWQSAAGKRYQLWARDVIEGALWTRVGDPVVATGPSAQQTDPLARTERYYKVEVLP